MNRQVNGKIVHFLCYIFVAMDKIFQEIKNSDERLQTCIEELEGRFGQRHDSTTRRKISPSLEVRVTLCKLLRIVCYLTPIITVISDCYKLSYANSLYKDGIVWVLTPHSVIILLMTDLFLSNLI